MRITLNAVIIVCFGWLLSACGGGDNYQGNYQNDLEDDLGAVSSELISDCPKYFPSSDRSVWHSFDGEYYYIDGSGRPLQAYKYLPPIVAEARIDSCQTSI